jgi:hypothetical protein
MEGFQGRSGSIDRGARLCARRWRSAAGEFEVLYGGCWLGGICCLRILLSLLCLFCGRGLLWLFLCLCVRCVALWCLGDGVQIREFFWWILIRPLILTEDRRREQEEQAGEAHGRSHLAEGGMRRDAASALRQA